MRANEAIASSVIRCRNYRRRILEISQKVSALHIAPAFSCIEIIDFIYHGLKRPNDTFILSKGHGAIAQYVVLESLGILSKTDLDNFGTAHGIGTHPDRGTAGIVASTGSLGHGLSMAVGIAIVEKNAGTSNQVICLISDGELFEGSTHEAILMASALKLNNLTVFVDYNDALTLDKISTTHESFDPNSRFFEWQKHKVDGHLYEHFLGLERTKSCGPHPRAVICYTRKGFPVSFMMNNVMWHYRSPDADEYRRALMEIDAR